MVVGTSRGSTFRKIVFLQIVSCHILARDVFEYVRLFFFEPLFQKYTSETSPVIFPESQPAISPIVIGHTPTWNDL